ncbi:rod shape-determining protein MreC [Nitrosomonas cryotolerans]|uniref:Cell shape-determining protein MreC n=1 Tax=Nitrosomonas cryotolerans ATCC 49181 TaxID=1131553 RepID=A0A1N6JH14_9PROT|nr:rod shape-determining protein MreC [Nitrosomonas cryotolerans]SFP67614.1 rod shape-determining protein MreC [Nitrosomonas cryotolerans]SIO43513.1 rod shape-determining protein MreC [Nitrosomonas cryotolerans ATCC 49181]
METTPPFFRHGPGPLARLLFFVLLSFLLMAEDIRFQYFPKLRQTIAVIIYPLQKLAHTPITIYDQVSEFLSNFHLIDENIYLRQRYLADQKQLLQLRALEAENMQLRKLLGAVERIKTKTETEAVMAEILYAPRDPFNRRITLNKGSQHNVQPGQVVVDNRGVVGQITQVYLWTSEVTLITDKDHSVPVQAIRNGLRSVISGAGKNDELELRYLSINTDIQQDDLLVTSGIGGVYPSGLPVAIVSSIERDPAYAFARIVCSPVAGVDRNRQVLILSLLSPMPENQIETPRIGSKNN